MVDLMATSAPVRKPHRGAAAAAARGPLCCAGRSRSRRGSDTHTARSASLLAADPQQRPTADAELRTVDESNAAGQYESKVGVELAGPLVTEQSPKASSHEPLQELRVELRNMQEVQAKQAKQVADLTAKLQPDKEFERKEHVGPDTSQDNDAAAAQGMIQPTRASASLATDDVQTRFVPALRPAKLFSSPAIQARMSKEPSPRASKHNSSPSNECKEPGQGQHGLAALVRTSFWNETFDFSR
eukprot:SAG31_NODE_2858_length_4991_cov_1.806827_4_plen_243_part_00